MGLADLVPPGVVVVSGRLDDPRWPGLVAPAEAAYVAGRPAVRRAELVAGRGCARLALTRLGVAVVPVGVRDDRGPAWPPGVVGSITHGAGEVAAAVARSASYAGIGVDVEVARPLDVGTARVVASDAELEAADRCGLGDTAGVVVLSAKESLFKAWAPDRGWLEPDQARLLLAPGGAWRATVLTTGATLEGTWEVEDGVVRTAAWRP